MLPAEGSASGKESIPGAADNVNEMGRTGEEDEDSISTSAPAISQASSAPEPTFLPHGDWWSTELGGPVEVDVDFVPDTQEGGGKEFIFLPDDAQHSWLIAKKKLQRFLNYFHLYHQSQINYATLLSPLVGGMPSCSMIVALVGLHPIARMHLR